MPFENATPRPWVIRTSRDTSGDVGVTADGLPNVIAETFADLRFQGERNAAKARANAELIVAAVNAYDHLRAAAEPIIQKLRANELRLVHNYSKEGSDDEEFSITQGEARALLAALKLARAET